MGWANIKKIKNETEVHGIPRKHRSLGTPPRLTFQARLLHNQEGSIAEKGDFERFRRELSSDIISVGVHMILFLVAEQLSLESQSRGCAKTPIRTVLVMQKSLAP